MSKRMRNSIRVLGACATIVSACIGVPLLTALIATLVALRFCAYELIVIGCVFDLLSMPSHVVFPIYTITACTLVFGFEPLRREYLV